MHYGDTWCVVRIVAFIFILIRSKGSVANFFS